MSVSRWYFAECFGLGWRSDIPLPNFHPGNPESWDKRGLHQITVEQVDHLVERRVTHSMPTQRLRQICSDGARIEWGDQAIFDLIGGDRVSYCAGPDWTGDMPIGFYATIAALICTWRGAIPMHASAVEWHGQAIIVAGPAGAGKSTSIAAMLAAGASLVGDDLTVMAGGPEPVMIYRGRPAIRLHADTAPWVPNRAPPVPAGDGSGKWIVRPSKCCSDDKLPLGALLILGGDDSRLSPIVAMQAVRGILFRPRIQAAMPGYGEAMAKLMRAAAGNAVFGIGSPRDLTRSGLIAYGQRRLDLVASVDRPHAVAPPI